MGSLSSKFKTYSDRWNAGAINSNWKGFQCETFEILRALRLRMTREERDLYPLLDAPKADHGLDHFSSPIDAND